jgi:hypothetical protein
MRKERSQAKRLFKEQISLEKEEIKQWQQQPFKAIKF